MVSEYCNKILCKSELSDWKLFLKFTYSIQPIEKIGLIIFDDIKSNINELDFCNAFIPCI